MTRMTKQKRTLIRLVIISFGISRAILSHQSQVEPTRVRNGHQESARANRSKPGPPGWYIKWPEWLSKWGHFLCMLLYHMTQMTKQKRTHLCQIVYHMTPMTKQRKTLIRLVIISFDISRALLSHQNQGEPTRVRNGHQEPARANQSKPGPPG